MYVVIVNASGIGMANWLNVNTPTQINDVRRETMTVSAAEVLELATLHFALRAGSF
jgi:hypothetical protein